MLIARESFRHQFHFLELCQKAKLNGSSVNRGSRFLVNRHFWRIIGNRFSRNDSMAEGGQRARRSSRSSRREEALTGFRGKNGQSLLTSSPTGSSGRRGSIAPPI